MKNIGYIAVCSECGDIGYRGVVRINAITCAERHMMATGHVVDVRPSYVTG